jgi:hypothetical protein
MKLIRTTLIVFTGLLFSQALYAQVSTNGTPAPASADTTVTQQAVTAAIEQPVSSNATTSAAAEAPVNGEAAATSLSPAGTPFEKSPYPIILEKMPFGTPPDLTAMNAAATSMDEAKMKVEQEKLAATFSWTAINITPNGKTAIGFTDLSAKPPANYYMTVGDSANDWKVVEADYTSETATIQKGEVRISLKFGNKNPIAPAIPGALSSSPPSPGSFAVNMPGHNHGPQPGITQPITEAPATPVPGGEGRPPALTSSSSSLLTSFRDRLFERNKARENEKLESERKQKEELSKIVTDALRKQQEETAAAAQQQQPQGETPAPQAQPVEMPVQ